MKQKPARPPRFGAMPHALTFYVTADERAAVLRTLRRYGRDRRPALLRALRVEAYGGPRGG